MSVCYERKSSGVSFAWLGLVVFVPENKEQVKYTHVISTGECPEITAQTTTALIPSSRLRENSKGSILGLAGVLLLSVAVVAVLDWQFC